jgi:hypothetical protein
VVVASKLAIDTYSAQSTMVTATTNRAH